MAIAAQLHPIAFGHARPDAAAEEPSRRRFHSRIPTDPPPAKGDANARGKRLNLPQRVLGRMIHWYRNNDFIHDTLYSPRSIHLFGREIPIFGGLACAYKLNGVSEQSCSEYGADAIREKGALKGFLLTLGRVASCTPWTAKPGNAIGERFAAVG